MEKKIVVFSNARKLFGKKKILFDGVIAKLARLGHQMEFCNIASDAEAEETSQRFLNDDSIKQLVIAGGDGTLNLILQHWKRHDIPLAIIPLGTCNVVARECNYNKNPDDIAQIIHDNHTKQFYCGLVNERLFAAVAGCGLDSYISKAINRAYKKVFGRLYLTGLMLKNIFNRQQPLLKISIDDAEPQEVTTIIFAKGKYYGGRYQFAPKASIFDPSLYLVMYTRTSAWHELKLALALFAKKAQHFSDIKIIPAQKVTILTPDQPMQLDGDLRDNTPATISVAPQPHLICVPQKSQENL